MKECGLVEYLAEGHCIAGRRNRRAAPGQRWVWGESCREWKRSGWTICLRGQHWSETPGQMGQAGPKLN